MRAGLCYACGLGCCHTLSLLLSAKQANGDSRSRVGRPLPGHISPGEQPSAAVPLRPGGIVYIYITLAARCFLHPVPRLLAVFLSRRKGSFLSVAIDRSTSRFCTCAHRPRCTPAAEAHCVSCAGAGHGYLRAVFRSVK